jgi:uncharacterized protein (DUF2252 family)
MSLASAETTEKLEPVPLAPPLPLPKERLAEGKARRSKVSRRSHGSWQAPPDRPDPIALLEESSKTRLPELVPIRYGRMMNSPFAFLRGSPIVMARDLAQTPVSGIRVQACGDCHLMNFGVYASPERNLLFDVNDFDETLPGPWEWDLKRLATSFVVAGRSHGFRARECREAAEECARSYREQIRSYSRMRLLDIWYSRVDADTVHKVLRRSAGKGLDRSMNKPPGHRTLQGLSKLVRVNNGCLQIVNHPPLVSHVSIEGVSDLLRRLYRGYLSSLQDDRRTLVERYRFVDFARKVVGVGSVGTRCYILLLDAGHAKDPLLLQIKEAQASILEPYAGRCRVSNHGHRVVAGQRLVQSASDIFLGWTSEGEHHFYIRQLRDMKASADLELMSALDLGEYARLCGWVLARAHARSGDPALIAGYVGKSPIFDNAIASFANDYADQVERDYDAFQAAVKSGRLPVEMGL